MGIFKLNKEVSETTEDIDPDDVVNVKTNLKDLGYYQTPDYGMTKFGDTQMFEGLRKMQKEKGLSVDGVAKPQGETEGMFNQLLKDGMGSLNKKWNKTGESFGEAFQRGYTKKRDDRRAHLSEGYQKAPITTGAAEMGAAAINPLNKFISPISKTAPIKVQGKQALKGALISGAAYGAGAGEGGASEHIKNIGVGAVSGLGGNAVSRVIKKNITGVFTNTGTKKIIDNISENMSNNFINSFINKKINDKNT